MVGGPAAPDAPQVRLSPASGTRALGKYLLFVKLGSGGQADVFLAVEQGPASVRRLVVIKRMRDDLAAHSDIVEMFIDEARLTTRLAHPNIVHTYEVGEAGGSYFIAMEYLEGQSLEAVLRSRKATGVLPQRMWAAIAAEALAGLHYAHELRDFDGTPLEIVHRDVSPHNVFLTYEGEVKIVDFGIAKATLNTLRTETGVLKGKLTYMAPEQTQGKADRRSDLFVLGIILWEALSGRRLFKGEPLAVLNSLIHAEIPPLDPETVDPRFAAIVMRALSREPADRFQTAEEMREALEGYIRATGEPIKKAEIGRAVTAMFKPVHDSVKAQIQSYMADLDNPPVRSGSRPEFTLPELRTDRPPGGETRSEASLARAIEAIRQGSNSDATRQGSASDAARSLTTARRSRLARYVSAAALAGLVVLGAVVALTRPRPPPAIAPTPVAASSTVVVGSEATRQGSSSEPAIVTVNLDSDPPEADVEWNGEHIGRTPARLDLPAGAQILTLAKDGFYDETLRVDVPLNAREPIVRSVKLRAKAAPVVTPATASAPVAPTKAPHPAPSKSTRPNAAPASASAPTTAPAALAPKDSW